MITVLSKPLNEVDQFKCWISTEEMRRRHDIAVYRTWLLKYDLTEIDLMYDEIDNALKVLTDVGYKKTQIIDMSRLIKKYVEELQILREAGDMIKGNNVADVTKFLGTFLITKMIHNYNVQDSIPTI